MAKEKIEAPRTQEVQAPRSQDVQAPRVDVVQAPRAQAAEGGATQAPRIETHSYKAGSRVGLLARVTDAHDKGNIVMLIEGTDVHVQIAESVLLGGVDLIQAKLREKREAEEAAAAAPQVAEHQGA